MLGLILFALAVIVVAKGAKLRDESIFYKD